MIKNIVKKIEELKKISQKRTEDHVARCYRKIEEMQQGDVSLHTSQKYISRYTSIERQVLKERDRTTTLSEVLNLIKHLPYTEATITMLEVSTSHITADDGKLIKEDVAPYRMMEHDEGYGTMFDVASFDDDQDRDMCAFGFSPYFMWMIKDAHSHGFDRVMFDADGTVLPNYATFEW
jgi:hypothetical protein